MYGAVGYLLHFFIFIMERDGNMIRTEIIAVGTEILMGQIVNSNAAFASELLANSDIYVYHHTAVGDNEARLTEAIKIAEKRSDLIILIGGLGPTEDDLTKQTLAKHLKKKLVADKEHLQKILAYYEEQGTVMTENNKQQAMIIEGATVLKNDFGFAAGMYLETDAHRYILLPGPPSEMKPMFQNQAMPILIKTAGSGYMQSKILRFFGIGESRLADDLKDLIEQQTNPTLATYAGEDEVVIRVTATGKSEKEVASKIEALETEILKRDGEFLYGYGNQSLAELVISRLLSKNISISAAESLTAGLFQATIGEEAGVSKIFPGGIVTYSAKAKENILGVSHATIANYGVVSKECAKEMALQVKKQFDTDIGISFTGVAGPDSLEGQAAGSVWIGLSTPDGETDAFYYQFSRDRNHNRHRAVKQGFQLIKNYLDKE